MDKLIDHIKSSKLVQAAITEAVHRFYYDRIGTGKQEDLNDLIDTNASDILSNLHNLNPDWRLSIQKAAKRYAIGEPVRWLPTCSKPKSILKISVDIAIEKTINDHE